MYFLNGFSMKLTLKMSIRRRGTARTFGMNSFHRISKWKLPATTSCPCPSETEWKFSLSNVNPNCFPNFSTSLRGSTPGERMKKTGFAGEVSWYDLGNSTCLPSVYFSPSSCSMKPLNTKERREHSRRREVSVRVHKALFRNWRFLRGNVVPTVIRVWYHIGPLSLNLLLSVWLSLILSLSFSLFLSLFFRCVHASL